MKRTDQASSPVGDWITGAVIAIRSAGASGRCWMTGAVIAIFSPARSLAKM